MLKTAASRLYAWVDERAGLTAILHEALDEPIPGGASYAYIFGSTLVFLFMLQVVTGMFLAMYYVPSAEDAHRTVEYISKVVTFGSFIRGLHHYGASAMVLLVGCHLLQVIIWGAYKIKRELVWLAGIGLLQLVLFFALTGYLLPWDMKAYFGTVITVNIASEVPLVGDAIKRIMLGGATLGTITLSRFFMVHVFVLPAVIIGGIGAHIYLFRRAKPAGPFNMTEQDAKARTELFYPKQFFKDTFFALMVFIILSCLAVYYPAPLEPRADPSDVAYIARPEWYFLWLFQLLKYFQGSLAVVGSLVIPGILITALTLLPFVDRKPERHPLKRLVVILGTLAVLATIGTLTYMAKSEDKARFGEQFAKQAKDGEEFLHKPFQPKEVGKPGAVAAPAPPPEIFKTRCAMCHGKQGEGTPAAPKLFGLTRSKDEIIKLIENPPAYGAKKMPPVVGLSVEERTKLAEWIASLK